MKDPMSTWLTLLRGLVTAARARGVPYNEEMATIVMEKIKTSDDLDLLINDLPPELEDGTDVQLGDPQILSPKQMGEWIDAMKGCEVGSKQTITHIPTFN